MVKGRLPGQTGAIFHFCLLRRISGEGKGLYFTFYRPFRRGAWIPSIQWQLTSALGCAALLIGPHQRSSERVHAYAINTREVHEAIAWFPTIWSSEKGARV